MCLNDNHWAVVRVDQKSRKITYYDSISQDPSVLPLFRELFNNQDLKKYDFQSYQYTFPLVQPRQKNSTDCGLFMLKTIESLIYGRKLNYEQADIQLFRDEVYVKLKNQMEENDLKLKKENSFLHYDITAYGDSQLEM